MIVAVKKFKCRKSIITAAVAVKSSSHKIGVLFLDWADLFTFMY